MKKIHILLVIAVSVATFLVVYTPHYNYPFPSHIDEWHHITEALRLQEGSYTWGYKGFHLGFHIVLLLLSKAADLVSIYRFLPAIWAVFSGLILFYVTYRKTGRRFYPALWTMIFFASIKSNVNITGLWFFNALTFSIPLIYLYVYFFTEGVEKENPRLILASLAIMVALIFVHSISVLFALPFLLIYSLLNSRHIIKQWKYFCAFLIIPITGTIFYIKGMAFYKAVIGVERGNLVQDLISDLQFRQGWGVLELKNSPFELYSLIGYILAAAGFIVIFSSRENIRKYLIYALWPLTVLISIIFYRINGVSFLSPYQRNLYYFAIGLPLLSSLGLDYLFKILKRNQSKIIPAIFAIVIFLTFESYWHIPENIALYEVIDNDDYQALLFLKKIPEKSKVLAMPGISVAIYPVSRHYPVGTYFFYGNRRACEMFFLIENCWLKQKILDNNKAKYVLCKSKIDCGWKLIYDKGNYIYQIH